MSYALIQLRFVSECIPVIEDADIFQIGIVLRVCNPGFNMIVSVSVCYPHKNLFSVWHSFDWVPFIFHGFHRFWDRPVAAPGIKFVTFIFHFTILENSALLPVKVALLWHWFDAGIHSDRLNSMVYRL